ncbi:MYB transcription factor [Melia azedarach]|uniref:MYB transcription factor n=1 Tax=Melia azedarach TaxID=155640 RepID=A0ACC1X0L1_MELAZ|nr:MYB transcription factor [Melia azedarach]
MPCLQGENLRKGPWQEEEDELLTTFVTILGERKWDCIARVSGLKRSGKSCRLRWLNYLRPNIKHGHISTEEEQIIIQLHEQWGNKWARIARRLPGRTDNEIKNYWRTHVRKKMQAQEQDNFQFGENNAKQDFLFQRVDFNVQKYEGDVEQKPVEDAPGRDNNSFDVHGFSSSGFISSPYEIQLLDWMSEFSEDPSKTRESEDSTNTGRISEVDNNNIWEWSGSIWDI